MWFTVRLTWITMVLTTIALNRLPIGHELAGKQS